MNSIQKAWVNLILFVVTLSVNTLGGIGYINGFSQKEISDMYETLITPSPSTFSIWGIIYALLLVSLIEMIIKKKDSYYQKSIDQLSYLFWISCLLNMGWIIAFSYVQIEVSVIFIMGLVLVLSLICQKLILLQDGKRWLLTLTFGLYTGWLFIASVVNIAAALVKLEWNVFGTDVEIWAIITLIIAILLVTIVNIKIKNVVLPLPLAWGYFGIYQNLKAKDGFNGSFELLQAVAVMGMIYLIGLSVYQLSMNTKKT